MSAKGINVFSCVAVHVALCKWLLMQLGACRPESSRVGMDESICFLNCFFPLTPPKYCIVSHQLTTLYLWWTRKTSCSPDPVLYERQNREYFLSLLHESWITHPHVDGPITLYTHTHNWHCPCGRFGPCVWSHLKKPSATATSTTKMVGSGLKHYAS